MEEIWFERVGNLKGNLNVHLRLGVQENWVNSSEMGKNLAFWQFSPKKREKENRELRLLAFLIDAANA